MRTVKVYLGASSLDLSEIQEKCGDEVELIQTDEIEDSDFVMSKGNSMRGMARGISRIVANHEYKLNNSDVLGEFDRLIQQSQQPKYLFNGKLKRR